MNEPLVNELKRLKCQTFSQDFVDTIIIFLRTFSTLILDEKYMGCLIKIENNSLGRPL